MIDLSLKNCFSYRNVFWNGVEILAKMVWRNRFFFSFLFFVCLFVCFLRGEGVEKLKISCSLDRMILFKFHQRVVQIRKVWSKVRQIYCKNLFSDREFHVTIADDDIESPKSIHTLLDKYLDHLLVKFEQHRMVQTIYKILSFFDKTRQPFLTEINAILEDNSIYDINNCLMLKCLNINIQRFWKTILYMI